MPLIPSNFAANSLSGTVRVSSGYANVVLTVSKYAFEDRTKTFTLKLRRDSTAGPVIAQSNLVTLTDFSEIVSLTANTSTVAEGNLVSFTLVTANVVNGANVFFSVLPVTANITTGDFFGANTGTITINSNQGTFALYANADYSLVDETNETFKVQIRTVEPTGNVVFVSSNVAITDFYKTINVFRFEESSSGVAEGSTVTFTVFAHNIAAGTLLYYYTSGNADISGSNTGSITMNSQSNTITLTTASTIPSNQSRTFTLKLATSNLGTPIATSNTITVVDSALAYLNATGGTVSEIDGYKIHTFTTSANLEITNISTAALKSVDILSIAGGASGGTGPSHGGGGGGGGFIYQPAVTLNSNLTIVIGAGGTTQPSGVLYAVSTNGSNTTVTGTGINVFSWGGGGGGGYSPITSSEYAGKFGGSGGGAGNAGPSSPIPSRPAGANVFGQGFPGGINGGGGGGASQIGGSDSSSISPGDRSFGKGGDGRPSLITGANVIYSGGGGAGSFNQITVSGGAGGGGDGGTTPGAGGPSAIPYFLGKPGTVNRGGGGGGGQGGYPGGAGGSGVVIIRYAYVPPAFYSSVTANSSLVLEGSNIFFVVNTAFANATTLYYDTIGNVTSSNFVNGNTGSFTVTSNATVLRLETTSTVPNYETKNFQLRIKEDSATTGNIVLVSGNVVIADATGASNYISATGGTESLISGYKIHTFTSSGTFTINGGAASPSGNVIDYLVVAGGGSGGPGVSGQAGGGGGAGGLRTGTYVANLGSFAMVVGAGGSVTAPTYTGNKGSNSSIFSNVIISSGGGGGGSAIGLSATDLAGGSGGGHGAGGSTNPGGSSTSGQGFPGGANNNYQTGGGGGAGQAGKNSDDATAPSKGGNGAPSLITGANVIYAGGGGGGQRNNPPGTGAIGGDGGGGRGGDVPATGMTAGTVNTGGGGGGAGQNAGPTIGGAAGGSGIIIVRYPYIG